MTGQLVLSVFCTPRSPLYDQWRRLADHLLAAGLYMLVGREVRDNGMKTLGLGLPQILARTYILDAA